MANRINPGTDFTDYDKQTLSDTIEDYAKRTFDLGEALREQVETITKRHLVLAEMEGLEAKSDMPLKMLEKRLALLAHPHLGNSTRRWHGQTGLDEHPRAGGADRGS
jgi:hypothetical protein